VHGVNTSKFGRLIFDYFVENMTPDITPYRIMLDDNVVKNIQ
jgi:hypothetical protein